MKPFVHADTAATRQFLILTDPDAGGAEIAQALAWIEASDANAEAFARVERFWAACDALPADARDLPTATDDAGWRRGHRWQIVAAAAMLLLCIAGLLMLSVQTLVGSGAVAPVAMQRYQTAVGQTRRIVLADGSRVTLGGASAVSVALETGRRLITLTDGQALFEVAKDRARPFLVRTGNGTVRAVGTVFDVHRVEGGTVVMLAEGTVVVGARDRAMHRRATRLTAGHQVSYSVDGRLGPALAIDPEAVGDWRAGKFSYVDRPLGEVIADLNRYSARPIIVDDAAIARIGVTGTVRVDRLEEWLAGLAAISDLTIRKDEDVIRLSHADGRHL